LSLFLNFKDLASHYVTAGDSAYFHSSSSHLYLHVLLLVVVGAREFVY